VVVRPFNLPHTLKKFILLSACIAFSLLLGVAHAETRYVSDELRITMRSGEDFSYQVIKELQSGTQLEVLSDN